MTEITMVSVNTLITRSVEHYGILSYGPDALYFNLDKDGSWRSNDEEIGKSFKKFVEAVFSRIHVTTIQGGKQ